MQSRYWDRFSRARISRRRMLQQSAVAGAAASAIWIIGCGSDEDESGDSTPGSSASATPGAGSSGARAGGTYNVGTAVDFDTFDPHLSVAGAQTYLPRLYNAIINRSAADSSFEFNDLAQSLEQPDDVTYVFTMRPGVKIAPNDLGIAERDLDANDIKATFDRIVTLPQSNAFGFVGQWVASTEPSTDGRQLTMKTTAPYGYFFVRIGSLVNLIIPKELAASPDPMKSASAGAGPFVLRSGSYAEGEGATLVRNPNYYRTDPDNADARLPYVDEIAVKVITERSTLRTAFQSGQTDQYTAQNIDEAKAIGGSYNTVRDSTNTFISFTMNPTKAPWNDDRVRKAASYAIDRRAYIDRIYSGEAQADGLVHWSLGDYALPADELDELQPYDPGEAKALIRAATGSDTIDVPVMWPAESIIQEHSLHLPLWLDQMSNAGFNVIQEPEAFATWLDRYTNRQYDASLALNQIYEWAEVNMDFQHSEGPARNNIYAVGVGALYPEIDAEIDRVKGITVPEEQAVATRDLQRMIYEKGSAYLPIVTPYAFTLYQPYVKNVPQGLGRSELFVNTWWLDQA